MAEINKARIEHRTGVEKVVAAIWSQALDVAYVGNDDNFFELGGDVALARRLVEQIRSFLGISISSEAIVEYPTVKDLAQALEAASRRALGNGGAPPLTDVEKCLLEIWRRVLGLDNLGVRENFFELGGNSLLAIRVATEARQRGLYFASRDLFRHQVISDLAGVVQLLQPETAQKLAPSANGWPATPIQRWFFYRDYVNPTLWNVSSFLKVGAKVELDLLRRAVKHLVQRHVALRLQFRKLDGAWVQYITEESNDFFHTFDLSHLDRTAQLEELVRIGNHMHESFKFNKGTLVGFGFFNLGGQGYRLLIIAHHLVCDGFSMNVLLKDLNTAYASLSSATPLETSEDCSFLEWASLVHSASFLDRVAAAEQSYWIPKTKANLPLDFPDGNNIVATVERLHEELAPSESATLLALAHEKYQTSIEVLQLWAVASCMMDWQNERSTVITMLGHGRENEQANLDLSRTVGYFTVHYPLVVDLPSGLGPQAEVDLVREQLDAVPNQGIGYGILRFIYNDQYPDGSVPLQEEGDISFNYLGNYDLYFDRDALFSIADEKTGSGRDIRAESPYRFGYFGYIRDGKLHSEWWFNRTLHKTETVQALANAFQEKLRSLIAKFPA